MATKLSFELVIKDGTVLVTESLTNAEAAIQKYKLDQELEQSTIRDASMAVFDALKTAGTKNVNMPYVINQVLGHLNIQQQPLMYKTMYDRVHKFLQENSQGKVDKATKVAERPDSLFVIGKGKNGGIGRRSDLDAARAAEIAES